jgi:putative membrane protein
VTAPGIQDEEELDYRFSLANERTYLAWIRTSLALLAGGVAAAKALHFNHEVWRWVVSAPPIALGAVLAMEAVWRWRTYEATMRAGGSLPVGRGIKVLGVTLAVYAVVALVATILDG